MSVHNLCFPQEIRKLLCGSPQLSGLCSSRQEANYLTGMPVISQKKKKKKKKEKKKKKYET